MTAYDISPLGVQKVLQNVQTEAEQFDGILKPLNGSLESLATATAGSGAILPAVKALFEHEGTKLQSMGTHISAAVQGAVNAVTAYNEGDLEMVSEYQRQAARDANPDRIPYGHGGRVAY